MYIRKKIVKGISYAYLVESKWDKEKKQSYQVVLKYLGRFEDLKIDKLSKEELTILSKYLNEKYLKNDHMDAHIRKYAQIRNKNDNKIMKQKIAKQKKIERVQQKVLTDLNMDKNQFSDKFGWKNTLSKTVNQIPISK